MFRGGASEAGYTVYVGVSPFSDNVPRVLTREEQFSSPMALTVRQPQPEQHSAWRAAGVYGILLLFMTRRCWVGPQLRSHRQRGNGRGFDLEVSYFYRSTRLGCYIGGCIFAGPDILHHHRRGALEKGVTCDLMCISQSQYLGIDVLGYGIVSPCLSGFAGFSVPLDCVKSFVECERYRQRRGA